MSVAVKRKLTPEEYLAIEREAENRSEYFAGEIFAIAGANRTHVTIRDNFAGELHSLLKQSGCRAYGLDMRVKVQKTGLYTYPDIAIVYGRAEFEDTQLDTLQNPRVIVEVLSESTEKYDRGTKAEHYRKIESLQEYVLVSQTKPLIERFVRLADGSWSFSEVAGMEATFEFASVPARVALAEIYRDVTFIPEELPPPR